MKRNIGLLLTTLLLFFGGGVFASLSAQQARSHTIQQGETLYCITQLYQITPEDLMRANPGLSATNFPIGLQIVIPQVNEPSEPAVEKVRDENAVRIAIALPFGLDETLEESARMLEFYQGFLLAVDTLKKQNISVDIRTYDTGKEGASIQHILEDPELKKMDYILGAYYWGHIKLLSDFCKINGIKIILPFSSNDHFVSNNPDLFMINTPQPYLYPVVQNNFLAYFPDVQIFFMNSLTGKEDKKDFVESFKYKLLAEKIPFEIIEPGLSVEEIGNRMKEKKDYVFVPASGNSAVLEEWISVLTELKAAHPDKLIHLFGYPEWQTYTGQYISRFYNLDTYIYSAFYTSNIFLSAERFKNTFIRWYHKEPAVTFPRYSMLGYDIGLFFITATYRYGTDFVPANPVLEEIPTIQNGFRFERVNEYGGYVNKNVYFINFSRHMEIVKTELR